jgi:hypothetical protein
MNKNKKTLNSVPLSQDELRKKIDGFSLDSKAEKSENSYKTIDAGVYYPPDNETN